MILLDRSLLGDEAALTRTFTEEYGHHLDAALGGPDSAGDEGEMFAAALLGDATGRAPPPSAFARMAAENDRGTVMLDGRTVAAEFDRSAGTSVNGTALSAEERAWCAEQERLIRSVLVDEGVAASDALVRALSRHMVALRRAYALALDRPGDEAALDSMRSSMYRTDDAFVASGFGHPVAPLNDGRLGTRFTGDVLPDGVNKMAFRRGSGDSDAPANEIHDVPLRHLPDDHQLSMAVRMLSAPTGRARHTGLEAWGDTGTDSTLGVVRRTIAGASAAPPSAAAQQASRAAIDEEIAARLGSASTKTDFENLAKLYAERASLELTGRGDGPGSLSMAQAMELRGWMEAGSLHELGYDRQVGDYGNFGRTKYEFAQVWLAADRAERLAWVGVDEPTWAAADAELENVVQAASIANELDQGIGGLMHDPDGWFQEQVLRPVTDAVLRPIVAADIPILSDGALMVESVIHNVYDLGESGVDLIGDTATALGHEGADGAWETLTGGVEEIGKDTIELVTTQTAIALNAGVDAIEQLTDQVDRRGLSDAEIEAMRPVFGDSIDYGKVVIRTGGIRDSIGMDAHAVAYEIHMSEEVDDQAVFAPDGETLTPAGRRLLAHELTHTWQYERFGPGYIGEALNDTDLGTDDETYEFRDDLAAGTAFLDMEPEAQASLIETVYATVADAGVLDRARFQRNLDRRNQSTLDITPEEFNIVVRAAAIVRG